MPPSLTEDRFIRLMLRLSRGRGPRPVVGIGDDAAVLATSSKSRTLVTTDFLTEGVHFRSQWTPPRLLGRKAMAVNLSDIAAMGGVPLTAVVSVGLPRGTSFASARALATGIAEQARRHRVTIVGGDTCAAQRLFVSVTLLGAVEIGREVLRSGARPGDRLYVTGTLGASAAGLATLRRARRTSSAHRAAAIQGVREAERAVQKAHLDPEPRVLFGRALGLTGIARAMIDLSDGIAKDLPRLCEASGIGAVLSASALPVDPAARRLLGPRRALEAALAGGEDYELLFAARPEHEPVLARLGARLGVPVQAIGAVLPRKSGVRLLGRDGRYRPLPRPAFEHFA
ncbi:MAG TPA: thiamine-phosphate kinase [Candidatus Polarisedimenticolia bacterium]|nr:thiamine-phosphate kinase [Candidatus Polarisedimenticolia bacterium]